ncbi:Tim44/TimA family putative adaptor protein [Limoniibacter endophyticus]|nr:Tim44/TimA family putative adaptor protein [Limoniibacter endophyticus]
MVALLDFGTLFFIIAAVVIFFQLRSVLGRRTGSERPPIDPFTANRTRPAVPRETGNDNVVSLPQNQSGPVEVVDPYAQIDAFAKEGTPVNHGLREIRDLDSSFEPKSFVEGARTAYEVIIKAFADGDRATLKNLLSKEVYDGFVAAISDREGRNEKIETSFVGFNESSVVAAGMRGSEANVTLRFVSQIISATRDANGTVIDGDPDHVAEVVDVWTFARDTRSKDPNWKLVATEAED